MVISNCGAPTDRLGFVKELQTHVDVHSYGSCMHNRAFPQVCEVVVSAVLILFGTMVTQRWTNCILHLGAYLAALPANPPESSL